MRVITVLRRAQHATAKSFAVFAADVGRGLFEISHNTLALVGLVAVAAAVFGVGHAEVRGQAERAALAWLQDRHEARDPTPVAVVEIEPEPDAVSRATATSLKELPRDQANLATWIARRYRVAPEPVAALVQEAWSIGRRAGLEPTLILAIMAVESSFNPFAQSSVGAQGLMQVMTRVHDDKYVAFGGNHAAFDPIANLRVGVQVLKECVKRAGSLQEGLRHYVGAALLEGDGGYVGRVLAEQTHMRNVADGKRVPVNAPATSAPTVKPVETRAPALEAAAEPASAPALADEQVALAQ